MVDRRQQNRVLSEMVSAPARPSSRPASPRRSATIDELEAALRIDRNDLDVSIHDQPELYYEVCKQLALKMAEVDAAKTELKEIEAKADADIRRDADEAGEKVTEVYIANQKLLSPDVRRQKEIIAGLELTYGRMQALEKGYHQRNSALERLLTWHMRQYYDPIRLDRASRPVRDIDAEAARQARAEGYQQRYPRR